MRRLLEPLHCGSDYRFLEGILDVELELPGISGGQMG